MNPRIESLKPKKLVGKRQSMSFANNKTSLLWKSFIPRRKEITNNLTNDLISLAVYSPAHFTAFNPTNTFERWAAVEVAEFDKVPVDMEPFVLPAGLYAVFDYKGSGADSSVFQYIFGTWLPGSGYILDDRPHFEVLGDKYKNNDPASEEEIWIPIQPQQ